MPKADGVRQEKKQRICDISPNCLHTSRVTIVYCPTSLKDASLLFFCYPSRMAKSNSVSPRLFQNVWTACLKPPRNWPGRRPPAGHLLRPAPGQRGRQRRFQKERRPVPGGAAAALPGEGISLLVLNGDIEELARFSRRASPSAGARSTGAGASSPPAGPCSSWSATTTWPAAPPPRRPALPGRRGAEAAPRGAYGCSSCTATRPRA